MDNLKWCIDYLIKYNQINNFFLNYDFKTFRGLLNITMPNNLSEEFYLKQDEILQNEISKKSITNIDNLSFTNNLTVYKGDITLLKCDVIVNAGNEKLLGCFYPLHNCIDNAIHSFAGLQMRRDLISIMKNKNEKNGQCKITKAYNLPSKYIYHTVGPRIINNITNQDIIDLSNCYLSCLNNAKENNLSSIAFPCISTGIYNFDKEKASLIAYQAVRKWQKENKYNLKIIFCVFNDYDYLIYKKRLKNDN